MDRAMERTIVHYVIGNGSLINRISLRRTCPSAEILAPIQVKGWRRFWTLQRSNSTLDRGVGPTVMNSRPDKASWFNGVMIAVPDQEYLALRAREKQYEPVDVTCENYHTGERLSGKLWSSSGPDIGVDWKHHDQKAYAEICLRGCADFGAGFLEDFLQTTYVGTSSLVSLRKETRELDEWIQHAFELTLYNR